jgi:hypothetical protein
MRTGNDELRSGGKLWTDGATACQLSAPCPLLLSPLVIRRHTPEVLKTFIKPGLLSLALYVAASRGRHYIIRPT